MALNISDMICTRCEVSRVFSKPTLDLRRAKYICNGMRMSMMPSAGAAE